MTNLVIGAAGAIGSAVVRQLVNRGEPVRALIRTVDKNILAFGRRDPEIVSGDVLDAEALMRSADGAEAIYNCVNFPLDHFELHKKAAENVVRAAAYAGACIVWPGNVWVYGPSRYVPVDESHPRMPSSELGRLKLDAEQHLLELADKSGVVATVVHFPDFYGPNVLNDLVKPVFVNALLGKVVVWPGELDVPHEFIHVDDAACALISVSNSEKCVGGYYNAPGPGTITARRFIEFAFSAAGNQPKMKKMNPLKMKLAALFNPAVRRITELSYLMSEPFYLDGARIKDHIGWEPQVSYEEGIKRTVDWFRDHYLQSSNSKS